MPAFPLAAKRWTNDVACKVVQRQRETLLLASKDIADTDLAQIGEHLKSNPNIRLIVVDPVSNYMGSAKMNAEQEVRAVLIPLKNLAERMGVSIIAVRGWLLSFC